MVSTAFRAAAGAALVLAVASFPSVAGDVATSPEQLVSWTIEVTLGTVAADAPPGFHPGTVDRLRVVYDAAQVDPVTGVARILGLQHWMAGAWSAPGNQPASEQSRLDVRNRTVDFQRAVTHGTPILIALTPMRWSAVYSQADGHMIIGGPYVLDPAGPVACAAAKWRATGEC